MEARDVHLDNDSAAAQMVCAQRMARLLVTAIRLAEDVESSLTAQQKVALVTATLLEFDGFRAEVHGAFAIERAIAELLADDSPPA